MERVVEVREDPPEELAESVTSLATPPRAPETVRLLQPNAAAQLVASAGVPEVLKVRLGVRFPLATTHPVTTAQCCSTTGSICWCARGVKGQVGGSIPTGNNPPRHMAQMGKKNLTLFQALRKEKAAKARVVGSSEVPNLQESLVDVHVHGGTKRKAELPARPGKGKDVKKVRAALMGPGSSSGGKGPKAGLIELPETIFKTLILSRHVGSLYQRELKEGSQTKVEELQEKGQIANLEADYDEMKEKHDGLEVEMEDLKSCIIQEHINGFQKGLRQAAFFYKDVDVNDARFDVNKDVVDGVLVDEAKSSLEGDAGAEEADANVDGAVAKDVDQEVT
ncbi:hypothetical protein DEO72_LG8g1328 [Vigna unguiculata]|uniref:Uncharacterized protein n=1 Tax=Vigna unguiculata TaxID=3917 RepID=A0A4D6MRB7_VIGUN|nr:hypothetical protein DEO72_LG8g1328 [Vigna unguiculata]